MDVSNFYGYLQYRNTEVNWLPMDTEELYDENYKNKQNRLLLEKYNWTKEKIKYKFNNYGFRCEDFKDVNNAVFLGCSHTIGIGIPIECSWTTLVSNEINLVPYNLGIGGGSWDTCFRIAYYWLEKLKPKIVVVMEPELFRMEWKEARTFSNGFSDIVEWQGYGPWNSDNKSISSQHFKQLLLYEENLKLQREKNKLAIVNLASKIKTKLIFTDFSDWANIGSDKARDLVHPGVLCNKEKAVQILKLI